MTNEERDEKYLISAHALLTAKREMAEINPSISESIQKISDEVLDEWIAQVNKLKGERS